MAKISCKWSHLNFVGIKCIFLGRKLLHLKTKKNGKKKSPDPPAVEAASPSTSSTKVFAYCQWHRIPMTPHGIMCVYLLIIAYLSTICNYILYLRWLIYTNLQNCTSIHVANTLETREVGCDDGLVFMADFSGQGCPSKESNKTIWTTVSASPYFGTRIFQKQICIYIYTYSASILEHGQSYVYPSAHLWALALKLSLTTKHHADANGTSLRKLKLFGAHALMANCTVGPFAFAA